jgi:hypothetical protein
MKMKKFFSLAAVAVAVFGMSSCAKLDNPIVVDEPAEPAGPVYTMDYTTADAYPFYRMAEPEGTSFNVNGGALVVQNTVEQANMWDLQPFIADFITVTEGNNYVVRITYKSTVAGDAWLNFGTWSASMAKYGFPIAQSDEFTTVDIEFPNATFAAEGNAHVLLQVGKLVGTITIQKVEVFESAPAA